MQIRRRTIYIGAAIVLVGALTATAVALTASGSSTPPAARPTPSTSSATPTPSATPEPAPVSAPLSVPAAGQFDSWKRASTTKVARVVPQVGQGADGSVAAYIDAPVIDGKTSALAVDAAVVAGASYEFSAQVRSLSPLPEAVDAAIEIGTERIGLPELSAAWTTVTGTFTAPADADTAQIRVVLDGPVAGLGIDDVSLVGADGENVVPNPSFEKVGGKDTIVNRSLILPASNPMLAVRAPAGQISWTATDAGGKVAAKGAVDASHVLEAVPLTGLDEGYYSVAVKTGAGTVKTLLGVIDYEGTTIAADPRFGVGLHVENDLYSDAADLTASLGIGLARNDVLWRFNETSKGKYDWADHYVNGFDRLHAHGIHLLGIVNYGNELYGNGKVPTSKAAIAAYGDYAAAMAERFDLVGLEVFNEFNHTRFNKTACGTKPSCYVPLLDSVHSAVEKVDPDLPIIAGSTARYDAPWFDGLWRAGGLKYSDAISFHPYEVSSKPESLAGIVDEANRSMKENGKTTRPIWITELGSSSKTGGRTVSAQADYLVRTSITALASGAEKFFWYDLINDDPSPAKHEGNFGMYYQKASGVAAFQPKPVGYAQALMIARLGGRALAADESAKGVHSVRFGDEKDAVRVVWAPKGKAEMTVRSDVAVTVTTMTGATKTIEPVDGVATIPVTVRPQFVESSLEPAGATPAPTVSQTPAG
ncbi:cellulase family glycosylhydrolase [Microbacterium sp. KSW4-11]|uniref:Cellulase family glycosylhydrolase n=1 Tax=Microbacterium gawkjiense TaxID=3067309 RepID=A0ABU3GA18_9MICO|nr:cellulase family glycosylhydrolase [Microbacterium sp. KSW4-11]MDT3316660.1 cellulase family glycosylhydrolase [Microbacterium sp. KSW4-11]